MSSLMAVDDGVCCGGQVLKELYFVDWAAAEPMSLELAIETSHPL